MQFAQGWPDKNKKRTPELVPGVLFLFSRARNKSYAQTLAISANRISLLGLSPISWTSM
jgi:hypothetical protein